MTMVVVLFNRKNLKLLAQGSRALVCSKTLCKRDDCYFTSSLLFLLLVGRGEGRWKRIFPFLICPQLAVMEGFVS